MLEDTLKEIRELGYEAMWTYDSESDRILVRLLYAGEGPSTRLPAASTTILPTKVNMDIAIDVAIRTLVEKLEKGETHE